MSAAVFLGLDVGSVTTKLALLDSSRRLIIKLYQRTDGRPVEAIQRGLAEAAGAIPAGSIVAAAGATGSARQLAGLLVGADVVKNEITAHAVAALDEVPGVRTVLEIGGQDSKIILIRGGVVVDFAMNTVCAAGTGSFLDHQAARLSIPIAEFGDIALRSHHPARIAGRCGVFAESDMIHKQQAGYPTEDIIAGLCEALVRNYLNNVARGKQIQAPAVFQGGVAANRGIKSAFERALGHEVTVPSNYEVMGAIGAAMLALEHWQRHSDEGQDGALARSSFRGFEVADRDCRTRARECGGCANSCEVIELSIDGEILARWGDRCGRWSQATGLALV